MIINLIVYFTGSQYDNKSNHETNLNAPDTLRPVIEELVRIPYPRHINEILERFYVPCYKFFLNTFLEHNSDSVTKC